MLRKLIVCIMLMFVQICTYANCNAAFTINGNNIIFTGLTDPVVSVVISSTDYTTFSSCNSWSNLCDANETISDIPDGEYIIACNTFDASWTPVCNIFEFVSIGTSCVDNDNDGICAEDDCNDIDPNLPAPIGSTCSDGDPTTTNDVIQSDGCTCLGTPEVEGCNVSVSGNNGEITIAGLLGSNSKIFTTTFEEVWSCNPWFGNLCGNTETIATGEGTFYVSVQSDDCNIFEVITVLGEGGECDDFDNDGFCANVDCDDNNPNLPATPGSSCDDGLTNTVNDQIQSDGCSCAGVVIGIVGCTVTSTQNEGVITITGIEGTNTKIFDTSFQELWGCNPWTGNSCSNTESFASGAGTFYISVQSNTCDIFEVIEVSGGGTGCDDSDDDGICDEQDCAPNNPDLPASAGTACNDFDSSTTNDMIQSDGCTCEGTPTGGGAECNISFELGTNSIQVDGLIDPIVTVQVLDEAYNPIFSCGTFATPCNEQELIADLSNGNYVLVYESFTSDWVSICDGYEEISLEVIGYNSNNNNTKDWIKTDKSSLIINTLEIFPNPVTNRLNITLEKLVNDQGTIYIYNLLGHVMHIEKLDATAASIDITHLENGIYTIQVIETNGNISSQKFMKTQE